MKKTIILRLIETAIRTRKRTPALARRELADASADKDEYKAPRRGFPRPLTERRYDGMKVFEAPAAGDAPTVICLHGSAYIHEFNPFHWRFYRLLARETGCGLSIPNYPLLPRHTWRDCRDRMLAWYRVFCAEHDMERVILLGDSAGGGLGAALLMQARAEGLPLPCKLLLLSPWVDVGGGNPARTKTDAMIDADGVRLYGEAWADGTDLKHPAISPLYGDLTGLPPTEVWAGSDEVLFDDDRAFCERLTEAGVRTTFRVGPHMSHDWPFYPAPEGRRARRDVESEIN